MRKAFYNRLMTDNAFTTLFPVLYERSSVVDSPEKPFGIYGFVGSPRLGRGFSYVPRIELWLYQERGSYDLINAGLARADQLMEEILQYEFDGERIAEATPMGWSGDLYDDVFLANTRNSAYTVIGSGR